MKRKSFLAKALTMLFAVLFSFTGARAQETLTVYDGDADPISQVPAYIFYFDDFTKSQVVFPAESLSAMEGGTISALTFYTNLVEEYTTASTVDVFLKEVDYTTISAYEPKDGIVYQGTLTVADTGELTIEFATPYVYGGGNLLLGIENTTDEGYKSVKFYGQVVEGASISGSSSESLDGVTANQRNFIPKTTFTYTPAGGVVYPKPTDLTVSDLTTNSATISWTEPEEKVDGYAYQLKKASEEWSEETTTVTDPTVALTGLETGTVYNFRVKAIYGSEASNFVSITFQTEFGIQGLPYYEGFETGLGAWKLVDCNSGTGVTSTTAYEGSYCFDFKYSTTPPQYLISPEFEGTDAILVSFWYTIGGANWPETFQVGYSTTTSDIDAFTWGDEILKDNTEWEQYESEVPAGTKFVAIRYNSNDMFYLFLDNFSFEVSNGLFMPSDLAVSEITAKSAKLSWTEKGTATAWEICVNGDKNNPIAAGTNPFVLEGLTPETDYTVKVRATDGTNFSKWSSEVSFTTAELYPAVTELAAEPSATTAVVSWNGTADSYNLRYKAGADDIEWNQIGSDETATGEAVTYTYDLSGYTGTGYIAIRHYNISDMFMLNVDDITVTNAGGDIVISEDFESGSIPGNWENLDKDGDGFDWGIRAIVDSDNNPIGYCATSASYDNTSGALTPDNWLIIPDVELGGTLTFVAYGQDPSWCSEVFGVFVGKEAAGEWTTVNNVTSPYTIESLMPETEYQVQVQAVYADGESKWETTNFTTTESNPIATDVVVTAGSTTATIEWAGISDSYEVKYRTPGNDVLPSFFEDFESGLDNWTIYTDGTAPEEAGWYVCNPSSGLDFSAHSGTYCASAWSWRSTAYDANNWLITPKVTFDKQMKFWVRTNTGYPDAYEVLLSTTGNEEADFTVTLKAMDLAPVVADWTKVAIDLSAYEGQEGYIAFHHVSSDCNYLLIDDFGLYGEEIPANEWTTVATTETSVELTGLTPETEYEFTIIGIKDGTANDGTAIATFTTSTAFPAPTSLAADNITTTSAEISWTADATATGAVLEYANVSEAPYVYTEYSYDNGTPGTAIGLGGGAFSWGVMFPAGSYTGTALNNVSVYDITEMTGTLTIYSGGDDAPATEIAAKAIALTGANDFVNFSFDNLTIDASQNLWIIVSNESGADYPAACAVEELDDANGRWVEISGNWYDLAAAGVPGYTFMIHAEVGAPDLSAVTWTTVDDATSPYELKDLTPETDYAVRVKSVFGTEGESEWAYTTFTTLPDNPVPFNIVADLAADGATLVWEGEGDSYNVQYRTAESVDPVYETSFYNLDDWTVYTEGEGDGWMITDYGATAYSYDNPTYTALNADNWLVSPAIELGGVLMFTPQTATAYPDSYEVLLSTTGNAIEDFTTTLKAMAIAENETVSINLSNYAGQTGYIAIHHVSYDCFIIAISDFGVYNVVPAGEWQTIATTDATATISGLATNNVYEYQVQSIKGSNVSEWSDVDEFALVTIDCNADNEALVNKFNGKFAHVTLANRVLYKDGTWNTVYLPFNLTEEQFNNSPLAEGDMRTLYDTDATAGTTAVTVDGQSVTLNFMAAGEFLATYGKYYGGVPYIVKWTSGSNVVNPEFANVTITKNQYYFGGEDAANEIGVYFEGTYDFIGFDSDNTSILFIGADNKLNYPLAGASIGATHGYFWLEGISAAEGSGVKFFTNLGDEDATGIAGLNVEESGDWYDISGRKLASKPRMKGIYVNGGRKVTVK